MINYDTIISNFDDKVTLYNWLRKVEEALKNASATNFVVNKKGNATLSFSITFADGETLESGDIVLQQGESVDQARIASGVLQLHLTNGTWLTAGNVKPVSNFVIDANQHLIVNYQDGTSQDLGAIFNGNVNVSGTFNATKVTGNEIVESMTGYSFEMPSTTNAQVDIIYAGAVKNGNKLTFTIFSKIKRTGDITGWLKLGNFFIPSEVANKIYPYTLATISNTCDSKVINAFSSLNNSIPVAIELFKFTAKFEANIVNPTQLALDTDYLLRYEVTFLLSDNLAQ